MAAHPTLGPQDRALDGVWHGWHTNGADAHISVRRRESPNVCHQVSASDELPAIVFSYKNEDEYVMNPADGSLIAIAADEPGQDAAWLELSLDADVARVLPKVEGKVNIAVPSRGSDDIVRATVVEGAEQGIRLRSPRRSRKAGCPRRLNDERGVRYVSVTWTCNYRARIERRM